MEDVKLVTEQPKKTSGFKKFMRWFWFILLLSFIGFCYWKYFFNYGDGGNRTGILQKFSHKGNIFKTYEGELVLSSVASTNNVALASEKFLFSVTSDSIAKVIQNYDGKRVKLHYIEKNGTLPWRGDSRYIVDGVTPETP
jgi:capsule polysaccharide export protein KpsE/RkpR